MKPIKKLVAVVGEYEKDGQTKKQYATVGKMFQNDDGSFSIKLDSVPVGGYWTGWLNAYDLDSDRKDNYKQGTAQAREALNDKGAGHAPIADDDIPF